MNVYNLLYVFDAYSSGTKRRTCPLRRSRNMNKFLTIQQVQHEKNFILFYVSDDDWSGDGKTRGAVEQAGK